MLPDFSLNPVTPLHFDRSRPYCFGHRLNTLLDDFLIEMSIALGGRRDLSVPQKLLALFKVALLGVQDRGGRMSEDMESV